MRWELFLPKFIHEKKRSEQLNILTTQLVNGGTEIRISVCPQILNS